MHCHCHGAVHMQLHGSLLGGDRPGMAGPGSHMMGKMSLMFDECWSIGYGLHTLPLSIPPSKGVTVVAWDGRRCRYRDCEVVKLGRVSMFGELIISG